MGAQSAISWTNDTFNPWIGCARVSPACDGCYAAALMGGEGNRFERAIWGGPGKGEGTRDRTAPSTWRNPRKWQREQRKALDAWLKGDAPKPPPRFVFCSSLADVFDNAVPTQWRIDLFELIRATPDLTWLLLTKRPGMILKLFADTVHANAYRREQLDLHWPSNAAIGCTIVTQAEADRDLPKLMAAAATLKHVAFTFVSAEPLLEALNLLPWLTVNDNGDRLGWVITGGETSQGVGEHRHEARAADPEWYRLLRDQCAMTGTPFHFKQWGEWVGEDELQEAPANDVPICTFPRGAPDLPPRRAFKVGSDRDPETLDGVSHRARPEPRKAA